MINSTASAGHVESLEQVAPLPWSAEFPEGSSGFWYVNDALGNEVATCYWARRGAEERAKHIAKAVNALEPLLCAIEKAQGILEHFVHPALDMKPEDGISELLGILDHKDLVAVMRTARGEA